MRTALFAYDFPHRKTQDFMMRLWLKGIPPSTILAAPWRELDISEPQIRSKIRHTGLMEPEEVAFSLAIDYHSIAHEDEFIHTIVDKHGIDLGIVAGARILSKEVIDAFPVGILNLHPGYLPHARGLEALWTSLRDNIPLAVTAHLIDEHVDRGEILSVHEIERYPDDTILDLTERLYESQLDILVPILEQIELTKYAATL